MLVVPFLLASRALASASLSAATAALCTVECAADGGDGAAQGPLVDSPGTDSFRLD